MGSCSCSKSTTKPVINTRLKSAWKDAIVANDMISIEFLHSNDPDIINEAIDNNGSRAIHFAIKTKNCKLLEYILENGGDINIRGGECNNSPLHEAVIIEDLFAVRYLFSLSVADDIRNMNDKTPFQICSKNFRRRYCKAKRFSSEKYSSKYKQFSLKTIEERSPHKMYFAGMELSDSSLKLRENERGVDLEQEKYCEQKSENEKLDGIKTNFGNIVGIDVNEIAVALEKIHSKGECNIWQNLAGKTYVLKRQIEIFKILYTLVLSLLRRKHKKVQKPDRECIRNLTIRMCEKLSKIKNDGEIHLTREIFVNRFHVFLYEIYDDMIGEEEDIDSSSEP